MAKAPGDLEPAYHHLRLRPYRPFRPRKNSWRAGRNQLNTFWSSIHYEERVRLAGIPGCRRVSSGCHAGSRACGMRSSRKPKPSSFQPVVTIRRALMLLTARHLHPTVRIIVSAKEEENVKLFKQGGADAIVSPATFGGYILAAAVDYGHMVQYLDDLLTAGGTCRFDRTPGAAQ